MDAQPGLLRTSGLGASLRVGHTGVKHRLRGVFSQALLLDGSPASITWTPRRSPRCARTPPPMGARGGHGGCK
jgi:hypothetical protein